MNPVISSLMIVSGGLLASRLEMSATAEGIEDLKQIGLLRSLGFHYAQGFAFARPMDAKAALDFLGG